MVIECVGLSYRYEIQGDEWAVRDIDLKIGRGEKVVIAGPAGSGKTTLLKLLDALMPPGRGDILYDGLSVKTLARQRKLPSLRRRMGVLFQFPEGQFFQETAYEELAFALKNFFGPKEDEIEQRALEVTKGFGLDLDLLRTTSPFSLSSGEKRKLALASALMISPEILMLDEPTAGLDAAGRHELIRILKSLDTTSVIIVTHNQEDFLCLMDRLVGIAAGRKIMDVKKAWLLDYIDTMELNGIKAPLVLLVQHWLNLSGVKTDAAYYEMEGLIGCLKKEVSKIKV